ncbi:cytochrome b/b6 domain-containing protein [Microlunatus parietis]|uniref:Formate dehydrogenase subunit gamma n=1 Tax=Microlunatus parietis TaxID=682979 RepID=A0A7Y9IAV3_9ACTN|nr:cytochrome b/b6 domain-containing protein [Microlunatus parietis]NYE73518.1 formate dehydrogenase subunit gamma [Microlunatus parietis]
MATDHRSRLPVATVERNRRGTRWLHAGIYVSTLFLLATGGWLWLGREGDPTVLAAITGVPDIDLHKIIGVLLAGLGLVGAGYWLRRIGGFLRETFRWDAGDLRWLARWPVAVFTGRFRRHEGDFDPGQRLANLILVGGLLILVLSGLGLIMVRGGPLFVVLHWLHLVVTFPVAAMIIGHVLIASGVLPGYRGAWRAMHLGGRLPRTVARRLWPAWLERHDQGHNVP